MDGIGAQWHQVTTDMQLYQCYKDKADAANLVPTTLSEQEKKDKASKIKDHIQEKVKPKQNVPLVNLELSQFYSTFSSLQGENLPTKLLK